jgi:predicted dithiol-disulfide oxidoreductase (DUF899 family)
MDLPPVVSEAEWHAARESVLAKEKEHMRAGDALAAERRRLPRLALEKDYTLIGPDGEVPLLDLFRGRRQLAIYHFMFGPNQDHGCDGCSFCVDQVAHLAHVHTRDASYAVVSRAPIDKIEPFKRRMGWTFPWYSSSESDFNLDFGVSPPEPEVGAYQDGETFGFSVLLRDDEARIYRTYFTDRRGLEAIGTTWSFLDRMPFGRQEEWEDSPDGYPQEPPYQWWRHHDRYEGLPETAR